MSFKRFCYAVIHFVWFHTVGDLFSDCPSTLEEVGERLDRLRGSDESPVNEEVEDTSAWVARRMFWKFYSVGGMCIKAGSPDEALRIRMRIHRCDELRRIYND